MTRLLVLLAGASIVACVAATGAAAVRHGVPASPHVTLVGSATTIAPTDTLNLHGSYTIGLPMVGAPVTVTQYDTPTCPTPTNAHVARTYSTTTGAHGLYGLNVRELSVGQHSFLATATWHGWHAATSSCLTITVVAAPTPPTPPEPPKPPLPPQPPEPVVPVLPSSYLCWNREMVDPVVYMDREADAMWTLGAYFEPKAILGNVEGGTNIGAYHLVCNAPSTLQPTGEGVGGSGEVYSQSVLNAYHVDHPVNGNDLNVYHIYK